jgi:hypothetical protein
MSQISKFIAKINRFLEKSDMSLSGFGRKALRDPKFLSRLEEGRKPTAKTIERVEAFMAAWQPPPRPRIKL